ncbi:MAG: MFS transporter [Cytophagales bacterium]|nr:MAG: MFS transporter [Cytophagales bacterium]
MNMLDGMDVMVISYTAPAIAKDWKIPPTALGLVFSVGLLGMAVGAMFLAAQADRIGRRRMILISAGLMGGCVLATVYASSVPELVLARFVSGLGIGSMLATTATLAAEYAPARTKDFWVSFVMSGYPVGAVLSGMVAARVIPEYGWQAMFATAGVATLVTLPVIYFFLGESPPNPPRGGVAAASPERLLAEKRAKATPPLGGVGGLLVAVPVATTLLLWTVLFLSFATLYFLTMWIPKLAANAGLPLNLAIYAGTVFNLGAFFGIITQGYLSARLGLQRVICGFLVATALLMVGFGFVTGSSLVLVLFGLIGFGVQGGFVGMYSLAAKLYPTRIRATGVGWAVGAGRIGAVVGPMVGGLLISAGWSMPAAFIAFAVPALAAGVITVLINVKGE